jgi:hypothetical protein
MDNDLHAVTVSLAGLSDGELHALMEAVNGVPQIAPGLLAWIEHAAVWELNRRRGVAIPLQPPVAAIPPEEDGVSVAAVMTLRATFAGKLLGGSRSVAALFDAVVHLLTGDERRH